MLDPIRIFIGTEPKTRVAARVLEFSIRRHTQSPVEVTYMEGPQWEYPLDGIRVGTGFSLRRWMIPKACEWKGRAIYMDADQVVFDDVLELWNKPNDPPTLVTETVERTQAYKNALFDRSQHDHGTIWCSYQPDKFRKEPWPQTSVMVIDCNKAGMYRLFSISSILETLRKDPTQYAALMHAEGKEPYCPGMRWPAVQIGNEWNHLNVFVPKGNPKHTRLLHYTKEPEQPWYKPDHPLAHLWAKELELAIKDNAVPRAELEEALARWGTKEDWRTSNGLHPTYRSYLRFYS